MRTLHYTIDTLNSIIGPKQLSIGTVLFNPLSSGHNSNPETGHFFVVRISLCNTN